MSRITYIVSQLFTRRWLPATLLVLVGMGIMIRLGFWQLDRLEQRRALNAQLTAALASEPLTLPADVLPQATAQLENRLVSVSGVYDLDHQLLHILQNYQGRSGVNLLTPLLIEGEETAVLIDRGWIPEAETNAAGIAQYDVTGSAVVDGYIALSETSIRQIEQLPQRETGEWFRIDLDAIETTLPYDLLPFYIVQSPPTEVDTELPYSLPRQVDLSEGPHLSYAIQWFIFSIMWVVIYIALVMRSPKRRADS